MKTLLAQWQINASGYSVAVISINPNIDPAGAILDLTQVLPGYSSTPIIARSFEILPTLDTTSPGAGYAQIFLDDLPINLYGRFARNVGNLRYIRLAPTPGVVLLEIRIYDVEFFGDALISPGRTSLTSSEPTTAVQYNATIYNKAGIWAWQNSGTAPFNSDADVSIPIKIRTPNPDRNNRFEFFGGINPTYDTRPYDNSAIFPMYWGTDAQNCTIPFHAFYTGAAALANNAFQSSTPLNGYFNKPILGIDRNRYVGSGSPTTLINPSFDSDSALHRFPTCQYLSGVIGSDANYEIYPDLFPRGEIWVCCIPRNPASGVTLYSQPLAFWIY